MSGRHSEHRSCEIVFSGWLFKFADPCTDTAVSSGIDIRWKELGRVYLGGKGARNIAGLMVCGSFLEKVEIT